MNKGQIHKLYHVHILCIVNVVAAFCHFPSFFFNKLDEKTKKNRMKKMRTPEKKQRERIRINGIQNECTREKGAYE